MHWYEVVEVYIYIYIYIYIYLIRVRVHIAAVYAVLKNDDELLYQQNTRTQYSC